MDRSVRFYRDLLGFPIHRNPTDDVTPLSAGGAEAPLLALSQAEGEPRRAGAARVERRAGLYHFAVLLPNRRDLGTIYKHLMEHGDEVYFEGTADHLVSESLYIRDPDFHGIEVTHDRDPSQWRRTGRDVRMATDPLDVAGLLEEADDGGWKAMAPGTTIGHVHLHVSGIDRSKRFYSELLGLHQTAALPGACFLAAGDYHHHVAVNTWLGEGIPPAREGGPGLDHFAVRLPGKRELHELLAHLRQRNVATDEVDEPGFGPTFLAREPDGIGVQLYSA